MTEAHSAAGASDAVSWELHDADGNLIRSSDDDGDGPSSEPEESDDDTDDR